MLPENKTFHFKVTKLEQLENTRLRMELVA